MEELLNILRPRLITELLKSAKTFLKTCNADCNIKEMLDSNGSIGEYVYFGISKGLFRCIDSNVHTKSTISLTKSGEKGFWVISAKIFYNPEIYSPFSVGIYCGNSKPNSVGDFLTELVEEINILNFEAIRIENKQLNVRVHCFICDMPARFFIKCSKGLNGFFSCERGSIKGQKPKFIVEFPDINYEKRTDESFRNQSQSEHHKGISTILRVTPPINMIFAFVLDFMHLAFEGIMKRLLMRWFVLLGRAKVKRKPITEDSRSLKLIRKDIPKEFQLKIRTL